MRRFNQVEWIGFILLSGLALYLTYLLREGEIISFIHPKRIPLMWATLAGIMTLVAYQSTKIFTIPSRKASLKSYFSLGFILLCGGITLTAGETDRFSSVQTSKNISIASQMQKNYEVIDSTATQSEKVLDVERYAHDWAQAQARQADEAVFSSDTITVTGDNYIKVLSEIENNSERHIGKKMILEGFIYREPGFAPDEFVIARMYMICCAADAQITGLMCKGSKSTSLADDQWVRVEGILEVQAYKIDGEESLIPIIKISEVLPLATPENQYIYY